MAQVRVHNDTDRCHGDEGPPVSVQHRVELGLARVLLLKHKRQRGEDQNLK